MDGEIDYPAVVTQLQLENEMLRHSLRGLAEVQETISVIPRLLERLWHKAMANKYQLLVGLMLAYWAFTVAFMLWDRWTK